uniref:DNA cytosine methyltransferase n=1 Tax=Streptomyces tubercidicus TaxID=47759 RepID=UPI0037DD8173|nr:DNA cytosine methyltransferase [Streptomyces tubercidicus]
MAGLMGRAPAGLRIGSLCTGYGGLDMAAQQVFGGSIAWVSDIDPGACRIIDHRMPSVPNIGDLTTAPWADLEPVDIVTGGYPCQPFSHAGLRKGTEDERHIWPYIATALRVLRPRYAIFENVSGHLRRGFGTVLADLASLGFDVEWTCVRASDVGAPNNPRQRLFILAAAQDSDGEPEQQWRLAAPGQAEGGWAWADAGGRGGAPSANADGGGWEPGT